MEYREVLFAAKRLSVSEQLQLIEEILRELPETTTGTRRERRIAALKQAAALRESILSDRGGELLPDSSDIIHELRGDCGDDEGA